MARRRWRRGGPVLGGAVLTVAVGVAVNQVEGPTWVQVTAFVVAVLLALGATMLARREMRKVALRLSVERGRPPRLDEADLPGLGVQPSVFGPSSAYVHRDHDADQLVTDPDVRLVVVAGPRLAGASRTLVHAGILHAGDQQLVCFEDLPATPLRELIAEADWAGRHGPGTVLWFDRARLDVLEQITSAVVDELPDDVRIFLTVDEALLDPAVLPADSYAVLTDPAHCVRLAMISPAERDRVAARAEYAELVAAHAGAPVLMGQLMVSFDHIETALTVTDQRSLARSAILRVVTDWARLQVPIPLDRGRLLQLAASYWRDLADTGESIGPARAGSQPDVPVRDLAIALADSIDQPVSGHASLVVQTTLDGRPHHRPHPLLPVVADDLHSAARWAIPTQLWDISSALSAEARRVAGLVSYARGDHDGARRMLVVLDPTAFQAEVGFAVGVAAFEAGDVEEARRWLNAVIRMDSDQAGRAMVQLGIVEHEQGQIGRARRWFETAITTGHTDHAPTAMVNLGVVAHKLGDIDLARRWYRQAIATRHVDQAPKAMNGLGVLEFQYGEIEQARHWFTTAIASGHADYAPASLVDLGILESSLGETGSARLRFEAAIRTGHTECAPAAMIGLAQLESRAGAIEQARDWYRRAATTGQSDSASNAMFELGKLAHEQGEIDQSRHWYQQTIRARHPDFAPQAAHNLGTLEFAQGEVEQAQYWFRLAITTRHSEAAPASMVALADLLGRRDSKQARRLCHDAIATEDFRAKSMAMALLGELEIRYDDSSIARAWLQAAIESGHPQARIEARRTLKRLDAAEAEHRRAELHARVNDPDPPGDPKNS